MPESAEGDNELAEIMETFPVILTSVPSQWSKNTPKKPGAVILNPDYMNTIINYPGIIANTPELEQRAYGVGIASTLPEIDGVTRRIPLISAVGENLYPSVALEILRSAAGDTTFQVKLFELGVEKMRIPAFDTIPTDQLGRIWIDWSQKSFSHSLTSMPDDFGGGIVIIGPTAAGTNQPIATALGGSWPHELQSAVVGTMFNGVNIERYDWADGAELLALLVLGVLAIAISYWTYGFVPVIAVVAGTYYAAQHYYAEQRLLFDITAIIFALVLTYIHAYTVKFLKEFYQKQQIKRQFGTYISKELVAELQKHPEKMQLGGDTRNMTFLFCDIRGFTPISEQYKTDPQGLTQLINKFLTPMTNIIMEHKGTIDKYMGDCIMAFWNAPLEVNGHEQKAVLAAQDMVNGVRRLNEELSKDNLLPINIGIGINTGACVVGNMGSDQRFDYSVLGDAVNLGSRLEGQSKSYGVITVIGEETARSVTEVQMVELDLIAVKGKDVPVRIFTPVTSATDEELKKHKEYLTAYRQREWAQAKRVAGGNKLAFGGELEKYYKLMSERITDLEKSDINDLETWDGVYRATTK
jgi:adenylate cyclase